MAFLFVSDGKPDPSAWASPKFSMFRADHSGWNALMVAANQGNIQGCS